MLSAAKNYHVTNTTPRPVRPRRKNQPPLYQTPKLKTLLHSAYTPEFISLLHKLITLEEARKLHLTQFQLAIILGTKLNFPKTQTKLDSENSINYLIIDHSAKMINNPHGKPTKDELNIKL